jgi:threonylcarbamoyladenosine tRNA methylthiotransferase MtaB
LTKFAVHNFGCRASQADGAAIESQLCTQGYTAAADARAAELVVLNTCTVTAAADDELRHIVRRIHRENPAARIVITGCYAQRAPAELIQLPGVSMVVGNSHKSRIGELMSAAYHGEVHVGDFLNAQFDAAPVEQNTASDRSRPNLKIQDGCPLRCSFCIIPKVRGGSRSARLEQVLTRVRTLSANYPEIVLTGINLGRWGREAGMRLPDLLRVLLNETDVQRLRLSSVEPMDWSEDLLQLMADSARIAKHVHAPMQSGSDSVLRRMRRRYRPHHYASRIQLARELMPDAAIGADVMVGFPGETEAEFEETVRVVGELPFTYLHIFPYSERPGTPAAESPDQIPWAVRKERGRALKAIAAAKNLAFRRSMLGRTLDAVTLRGGEAITSNYLTVALAWPREPRLAGSFKIGGLTESGLFEEAAFNVLPAALTSGTSPLPPTDCRA